MSTVPPSAEVIDSVNNSRQPFGLPLGTIRGLLSLLICSFFWIVLLWPEQVVKPLLAHFFMLALVLLVFSPYSKGAAAEDEGSRWLPRFFRWLFVAGSIAVVAFVAVQHPERLGGGPNGRITPSPEEFKEWWGAYLACTFGGFAAGLLLRVLLGTENPVFQTLRAWLSVVGMLLLMSEIVFWFAIAGAENKPEEFVRIWQAFELAIISAYFGTRA